MSARIPPWRWAVAAGVVCTMLAGVVVIPRYLDGHAIADGMHPWVLVIALFTSAFVRLVGWAWPLEPARQEMELWNAWTAHALNCGVCGPAGGWDSPECEKGRKMRERWRDAVAAEGFR